MIHHNLNILANNLINLPKIVEKNATDLVRKVAIGIMSSVTYSTPVDTGKARANWQVSLRNPIFSELEEFDKSGRSAVSKGRAVIVTFNLRDKSINITNSLPYINRLNHGWSKQASAGYIERSIENVHFVVENNGVLRR